MSFIPEERRRVYGLDALVEDDIMPQELAVAIRQYFQGGMIYVSKATTPNRQRRQEQKEEAYRRLIVYKEPIAVVARDLPYGGVSRTTIYKWLEGWKDDEVQ